MLFWWYWEQLARRDIPRPIFPMESNLSFDDVEETFLGAFMLTHLFSTQNDY